MTDLTKLIEKEAEKLWMTTKPWQRMDGVDLYNYGYFAGYQLALDRAAEVAETHGNGCVFTAKDSGIRAATRRSIAQAIRDLKGGVDV